MQRERDRRNWDDRNRSRAQSYHGDQFVRPEIAAKQTAAAKQYKAALEALFEKKPDAANKIEKMIPAVNLPRVVESAEPQMLAEGNKRQDLLRKIGAAQGPKAISDAIEAFLGAGHTLPDDQEVFLQMLEHRD